jgi:REP element-mobilizing transposase RayT
METFKIHDAATVYFVTYSVVDWLPVFTTGTACQLLTQSLTFCHQQKGLRINAYVIMPTHFHAIIFDKDHNNENLVAALDAFRKFTGRALADHVLAQCPAAISEVLYETSGHDRNRRFWQPTRHPEGINSEKFWRQKLDYLHDNPCRKGLVLYPEYWRYSSAAFYEGGESSVSQ